MYQYRLTEKTYTPGGFEVGDVETLKGHVLYLLENQSFSDKMSQAAYQKFLNNYEYEVSMGKFIDMYKAISMKS